MASRRSAASASSSTCILPTVAAAPPAASTFPSSLDPAQSSTSAGDSHSTVKTVLALLVSIDALPIAFLKAAAFLDLSEMAAIVGGTHVLFCFVLFGLQLSVCLWWLQVPLRDLSDA